MNFQLNVIVILILICVCECTMMEINLGDTELQKNILKFGYGIIISKKVLVVSSTITH